MEETRSETREVSSGANYDQRVRYEALMEVARSRMTTRHKVMYKDESKVD